MGLVWAENIAIAATIDAADVNELMDNVDEVDDDCPVTSCSTHYLADEGVNEIIHYGTHDGIFRADHDTAYDDGHYGTYYSDHEVAVNAPYYAVHNGADEGIHYVVHDSLDEVTHDGTYKDIHMTTYCSTDRNGYDNNDHGTYRSTHYSDYENDDNGTYKGSVNDTYYSTDEDTYRMGHETGVDNSYTCSPYIL